MTERELKHEFATRLRRLMYKRGELNQKQLAALSGISEVTISYYRTEKLLPKTDNLVRLAHALNCSIDELIPVDEITD